MSLFGFSAENPLMFREIILVKYMKPVEAFKWCFILRK